MPPAKKRKTKQAGLWGNKTKEQKVAEEKAAAWEAGCQRVHVWVNGVRFTYDDPLSATAMADAQDSAPLESAAAAGLRGAAGGPAAPTSSLAKPPPAKKLHCLTCFRFTLVLQNALVVWRLFAAKQILCFTRYSTRQGLGG